MEFIHDLCFKTTDQRADDWYWGLDNATRLADFARALIWDREVAGRYGQRADS
jgi:hypothetical protein